MRSSLKSDLERLMSRERDAGKVRDGRKLLRQAAHANLATLQSAVAFAGRTPTATHQALCDLLSWYGRKRHAPILLAVMQNPKSERQLLLRAAKALSLIERARAVPALLEMMSAGDTADQREAAAYALAWYGGPEVRGALIEVVGNKREEPAVRAQAAEGVGYHFQFRSQRSREFCRALSVLCRALRDQSVEVRSWAVFALGQLHSRKALPVLRKVARTDTELLAGWWYVNEEATGAIASILGREHTDPIPVWQRQPTGESIGRP